MSWSNTPPTAPGLYWVVFKIDDEREVLPALYAPAGDDGFDIQLIGSDEWFHTNRFKLFHPMSAPPVLPPT